MTKLHQAIQLFDDYNKQDPNKLSWKNEEFPAEYFYALQLTEWVKKLTPNPSESLLLAARSQHIGRWKTPRNEYPAGKAGYLNWRKNLSKFHADTAGKLMVIAGYDTNEVESVQRIIRKDNLRFDEEVQLMENALCLVFLEFQYEDFLQRHDDDDLIIRILHKTLKKMTAPGHEAALKLNYSERGKNLLEKALTQFNQ